MHGIVHSPELTVNNLMERAALRNPEGPAILAPSRPALSYKELLTTITKLRTALVGFGIGKGDRIATLLRSGPETAVLSLAVLSDFTLAPLNPELSVDEITRYLAALGATVLIVPRNIDPAVVTVARSLRLCLVRLEAAPDVVARNLSLEVEEDHRPGGSGSSHGGDIALVLHTSGTTSAPKIVPLTQSNICASARNIARSLQLDSQDRCLDVMPLFHVHGLIGGLLASIGAAAAVICPPAFIATEFFDWYDEFKPTWYTAVPTMHQAILARSDRHTDIIARGKLRFIRSCSSALANRVAEELEATFGARVVEAYGMTEAAHQLAVTPLSHPGRRAGSVGRASGPQVAIMDEAGHFLAPERTGEVVVRGESVMAGYENNVAANAEAFCDGWFRTGDQGFIDSDGYLFLTGRIKELINRAGEKIAPREVDEALLEHPAVAQAIAFGVPHPTLGEEVGAAVVLNPGVTVEPSDLRAHAGARLAAFKVPQVLRIVDAIPNGPTGKPQRMQLPQLLGLLGQPHIASSGPVRALAPSALEKRLAQVWAKVLRIDSRDIGCRDNFFELGGDSILAAQLVAQISALFRINVSLLAVFEHQSLDEFSEYIERGLSCGSRVDQQRDLQLSEERHSPRSLVPIQAAGDRPPLFAVHGVFGDVACFSALARELGPEQPLYGLQARGLDGREAPLGQVEEMARAYIAELRTIQPRGPYHLLGYSSGGTIAFEMARQLELAGQEVALLAVIDHSLYAAGYDRPQWSVRYLARAAANITRNVSLWVETAGRLGWRRVGAWAQARVKLATHALRRANRDDQDAEWLGFKDRISIAFGEYIGDAPHFRLSLIETQHNAVRTYTPRTFAGSIVVFNASRQPLLCSHAPDRGWSRFVRGEVVIKTIRGNHHGMLSSPCVTALARELEALVVKAPGKQDYLSAA